MKVHHILRRLRLVARFLRKLPATAVFAYLGLVAIPVLALIDVLVDFPRGDQDWKIYLMYWPATMLFCALIGLLADGFEKLLLNKDKRNDV